MWTHTHTHTHTHTLSIWSSLSVKPSDVWSCFAWFRRSARGDKPFHLNSYIKRSQRRRVGESEREMWAQWPIYSARELFSTNYSITQYCRYLHFFLLTFGRPPWMRLRLVNTEGILHDLALQIRGKWSSCSRPCWEHQATVSISVTLDLIRKTGHWSTHLYVSTSLSMCILCKTVLKVIWWSCK